MKMIRRPWRKKQWQWKSVRMDPWNISWQGLLTHLMFGPQIKSNILSTNIEHKISGNRDCDYWIDRSKRLLHWLFGGDCDLVISFHFWTNLKQHVDLSEVGWFQENDVMWWVEKVTQWLFLICFKNKSKTILNRWDWVTPKKASWWVNFMASQSWWWSSSRSSSRSSSISSSRSSSRSSSSLLAS